MSLRSVIKRVPLATSTYRLLWLRGSRGRKARFAADYLHSSGPGSDLAATQVLRGELPDLLRSLSVRSMLDVPCGDFVWMRHVDLGSIRYIGADIIDEHVASHQKAFSSARRTFVALDLVTAKLPEVDLIFCRDCLPHFSYQLLWRALRNIKRARARYLLTTTFPEHSTNKDIITGSWRPLNLCAPPFNFPPPLRLLNEGHRPPYADKSLGLWELQKLPAL